jgi:hypothetical protein
MGVPRGMEVQHPLVKVGAHAKIVIFRARLEYEVRTPGGHCYPHSLYSSVVVPQHRRLPSVESFCRFFIAFVALEATQAALS